MKRFLILLLLAWPTMGWGQTYDTIGQKSATDNVPVSTAGVPNFDYKNADPIIYLAGDNDSVLRIGTWTEGVSQVALGIYVYNTGTSRPTTLAFADTLVRSTANNFDSLVLSPPFHLTPGTTYILAQCVVAATTPYLKRTNAGVGIAYTSTGGGLPSTYNATNDGFSGDMALYAIVGKYTAGGSTALTVGGATMGSGTVGGE